MATNATLLDGKLFNDLMRSPALAEGIRNGLYVTFGIATPDISTASEVESVDNYNIKAEDVPQDSTVGGTLVVRTMTPVVRKFLQSGRFNITDIPGTLVAAGTEQTIEDVAINIDYEFDIYNGSGTLVSVTSVVDQDGDIIPAANYYVFPLGGRGVIRFKTLDASVEDAVLTFGAYTPSNGIETIDAGGSGAIGEPFELRMHNEIKIPSGPYKDKYRRYTRFYPRVKVISSTTSAGSKTDFVENTFTLSGDTENGVLGRERDTIEDVSIREHLMANYTNFIRG